MLPDAAIAQLHALARAACTAEGHTVADGATAAECAALCTGRALLVDCPERWRAFATFHAAQAVAGGDENATAWQHYRAARFCAMQARLAVDEDLSPKPKAPPVVVEEPTDD